MIRPRSDTLLITIVAVAVVVTTVFRSIRHGQIVARLERLENSIQQHLDRDARTKARLNAKAAEEVELRERAYYPPHVLKRYDGNEDPPDGLRDEYLSAMKEPSLWALSRKDRMAIAYRFVWQPSFHRPVCVRIMVGEDVTLHVVQLHGKGGYPPPGKIATEKRVRLTQEQWHELERRLNGAKFWSMPSTDDELGSDGAVWRLEGVKDGQYHIVDRWSPESGDFHDLCKFMIDLSGLDVELY